MPARAKARMAAWPPGPGVFCLVPPRARILMWRAVTPISLHRTATSWAACIAAYGEVSSRSAFFHTTGNSGDGFFSREIGNVDEGIIVRGVQVADAKNVFSVGDLWTESDDFFLL